MRKGKAIILLYVLSVILVFFTLMTFLRFPVGVKNYNGILGATQLDGDIATGYAYTLVYSDKGVGEDADVTDVIETLTKRLNILGYQNPIIQSVKDSSVGVKDYNIRVVIPALINDKGVVDNTKMLEDVQAAASYGVVKFYGDTSENPVTEIMSDITAISGATFRGSFIDSDGSTKYAALLNLSNEAYEFLTKEIEKAGTSSYYLSVKLDNGDSEELLLSGAISSDLIASRVLSISNSNEADLRQKILKLSTGGLAYKYEVEGAESSAVLSNGSSQICLIAILTVVLAYMVGLIVKFKGIGLAGALAMLVFILVDNAMLIAIPGITVGIGSIVGMIFASILAGFGISLVAKRILDESLNGKTVKASIKSGFNGSFKPILNLNFMSALAGLLLFIFTTGAIKMFAITFAVGAVVSFLSTILIARLYVEILLPIAKTPEKFFNIKGEE